MRNKDLELNIKQAQFHEQRRREMENAVYDAWSRSEFQNVYKANLFLIESNDAGVFEHEASDLGRYLAFTETLAHFAVIGIDAERKVPKAA